MSWFTSFFTTVEADIIKIVTAIKTEEQILAKDVNLALKWIAANTPAITADIQQVLSIIQVVGITSPQVEAAVVAANTAVTALNAYATAYKNGTGTPAAVIAGYSAYKNAQASAAQAASAAVLAPTPQIATLLSKG